VLHGLTGWVYARSTWHSFFAAIERERWSFQSKPPLNAHYNHIPQILTQFTLHLYKCAWLLHIQLIDSLPRFTFDCCISSLFIPRDNTHFEFIFKTADPVAFRSNVFTSHCSYVETQPGRWRESAVVFKKTQQVLAMPLLSESYYN
jgi:hypothetical protein